MDLRIGVIGLGYWGPNLVRNLSDIPGATLATLCDINSERLKSWKRRMPWVNVTPNPEELFSDPAIDAVAIATPVGTHFDLASRALRAGKHVFVEKPLAATRDEARALVNLARLSNRILMVDHVFLYTSAVEKMKEIIESGELGEILYFDSVRVNLGLFQSDVNVVWDLAPHDLSIMDYIIGQSPRSVRAMGSRHAGQDKENIAYINLQFDHGLIANFHVNWLAPVKIRQILIGGTKKMILYNDIEPTEKIKIYDKGVDVKKDLDERGRFQTLISYRTGDVLAPKLAPVEGLHLACRDFVSHIASGRTSFRADGTHGFRVVSILESIDQSLRQDGERVLLDFQESHTRESPNAGSSSVSTIESTPALS